MEDLQSLSNINIYEMQMSKFLSGLTHTDVRKRTDVCAYVCKARLKTHVLMWRALGDTDDAQ